MTLTSILVVVAVVLVVVAVVKKDVVLPKLVAFKDSVLTRLGLKK